MEDVFRGSGDRGKAGIGREPWLDTVRRGNGIGSGRQGGGRCRRPDPMSNVAGPRGLRKRSSPGLAILYDARSRRRIPQMSDFSESEEIIAFTARRDSIPDPGTSEAPWRKPAPAFAPWPSPRDSRRAWRCDGSDEGRRPGCQSARRLRTPGAWPRGPLWSTSSDGLPCILLSPKEQGPT